MSAIYKLSESGRRKTYSLWIKIGGCGVPNDTFATTKLGPMTRWEKQNITLGQIEDACPYTGRSLARFAIDYLDKPTMAIPYDNKSEVEEIAEAMALEEDKHETREKSNMEI